MKREFKGQEMYGNWTLLRKIKGGGNGEVWICRNEKGEKRAIKLLKKDSIIAYQRFKYEIDTINENQHIDGIIEIIDYYKPHDFKKEVPFYVMPLGQSIMEAIEALTFDERINIVIQISECLVKLHGRQITHRDIKPSNLLLVEGQPHLIDFGLVDFPDKLDLTGPKERIGPRWTMAPEINRDSSAVDFLKADVYSLAKTLWILLMGIESGFEGQYNINTILELRRKYPAEYTTPIDNLLTTSTDNDPHRRPSIGEFYTQLRNWKKVNDDFHLSNNEQWSDILTQLFPVSIPSRVIWHDIDEIIKILQIISNIPSLNHMFFPDSGGMDLEGVRRSVEPGCIELDCELIYIVKPQRLLFESFGFDAQWNYFRLETAELEPSGIYPIDRLHRDIYEEVSELFPGTYEHRRILEDREYYRELGYEIPDDARHIFRYFGGAFVIFNKRSTYNLTNSTYDGRHNAMSTDEFRLYIQRSIEANLEKMD